MKDKTKAICNAHIDNGCRKVCPLATPCTAQAGDNMQIFADRMDKAALSVKLKGWP